MRKAPSHKAGRYSRLSTPHSSPKKSEVVVRRKDDLMNRTDYQGMRQLFDDGNMIWVENQQNHMKGRVVGFESGIIEVETDKHCECWGLDVCTELTYGYKKRYDEVLKHPHEFDSHLD